MQISQHGQGLSRPTLFLVAGMGLFLRVVVLISGQFGIGLHLCQPEVHY